MYFSLILHRLCFLCTSYLYDVFLFHTQEEYDNTTVINYYRTVKKLTAPIDDPNSPVAKADLNLVSIKTETVKCPYAKKWMENPGDPIEHAKWYVNGTLRAWSNHSFYSGRYYTKVANNV